MGGSFGHRLAQHAWLRIIVWKFEKSVSLLQKPV
jgi:hypothetical protein